LLLTRPPLSSTLFPYTTLFRSWMLGLLDRPYLGSITVMSSCLFGVSPLAIVTIMSGASNQPRWLVLNMVFIGRTIQFLAIAYVIHGADLSAITMAEYHERVRCDCSDADEFERGIAAGV